MRLSVVLAGLMCLASISCNQKNGDPGSERIRPLRDTIGFAQYPHQMDSLMQRMARRDMPVDRSEGPWRLAICPHDDYTYANHLYPNTLSKIDAPLVFLFGVAHKASDYGLRDRLVFDSHTHWKGPWNKVRVHEAREALLKNLPGEYTTVNDSMHRSEHSLEALIPFLQYYNKEVQIVPILVPYMKHRDMEIIGRELAEAIHHYCSGSGLSWGTDYALLITTDAVHYGTEDWGGKNYARFGCDEEGNKTARAYEKEIIENCLSGPLHPEKIRRFVAYTVQEEDYTQYKWTWCGRYCVPLGMLTAWHLGELQDAPLSGDLIGYTTSLTNDHIPVQDLGMGTTAVATDCHWVGYAALGYR